MHTTFPAAASPCHPEGFCTFSFVFSVISESYEELGENEKIWYILHLSS